ncbi:hypothetical protein [Rhizobium lentis]|uniref:hypothetical protein n=1 Tax=Rhizobium lentis TaxID=1138194 RepID=UPI001C837DB5|nr:hypothetical protein [Rhizobium lentis]MBX5015929.1 hypothetical protein [Rhizobium lentis]
MTPDFSPAMLKRFLRARVGIEAYGRIFAAPAGFAPKLEDIEAEEKRRLRKSAGITEEQFDLAWSGRGISLEPRQRLWKALGVDPAACGVRLLDQGKQERMTIRRAGRAA